MTKHKTPTTKKIHIELPVEVHQQVRVKAALKGASMQALVSEIVARAVKDVVLPQHKIRNNLNAF